MQNYTPKSAVLSSKLQSVEFEAQIEEKNRYLPVSIDNSVSINRRDNR